MTASSRGSRGRSARGWVAYRLGAEWRRRRLAWCGLALLVGSVGGLVTAIAIGAHRGATSYDRFAVAQAAADVLVRGQCSGRADDRRALERCLAPVTALPSVSVASLVTRIEAYVETLDGRSIQPLANDPCYSGPGRTEIAASADGRYGVQVNRHRIVAGRPAVPARSDEVVISETIADRVGLRPGDRLRVHVIGAGDCLEPDSWQAPMVVAVVGVTRTPYEVKPSSGEYRAFVHATPAFLAATAEGARRNQEVAARLRDGSGTGVARLRAELEPLDGRFEVERLAPLADAVEDTIRPYSIALAAVALLAGLAAVAVLGPALSRQLRLDATDRRGLRLLGAGGRDVLWLGVARSLLVGAIAAAVAWPVAIALAPRMLFGPALALDTTPGWTGYGLPLAIATGAIILLALGAGVLGARTATGTAPRTRRSVLSPGFARSGLPLPATAGAHLAFTTDGDRSGPSTRLGFFGVLAGVVVLVAALTFSASLAHLLDTPALRGETFEAFAWYPNKMVGDGQEVPVPLADVQRFFENHPAVDRATFAAIAPFPEGVPLTIGDEHTPVPIVAFDTGRGAVEPAVIRGRAPQDRDEIALGEATLVDLGLRIGDTVEAQGRAGTWEQPGAPTKQRFEIVGTAVGVQGGDAGLGRAAYTTLAGARELNPQLEPQNVLVRLAPGADLARLSSDFAATFPGQNSLVPFAELAKTANTLDIARVDVTPLVLAGIVAIMAAGVMVHLLAGSVRAQARRLAILATLGFRPAQVRRAAAWEASLLTGLVLLVGVPLGIAVGRVTWVEYAQSLHVIRVAVVPWPAIALVVSIALALANITVLPPAWRVSRAAPATVLRAE